MSPPDTATLQRLQMQIDCTSLVHRLYLMLDEHDLVAFDEIFAPDAEWVRLGELTRGLDAIRHKMAGRSPTLATRHLIGNAVVLPDGPGRARGSFYMTVVRKRDVPPGAARPLLVNGPWRVSVLDLRFVHGPAGWRIAHQSTRSEFEFAGEAQATS